MWVALSQYAYPLDAIECEWTTLKECKYPLYTIECTKMHLSKFTTSWIWLRQCWLSIECCSIWLKAPSKVIKIMWTFSSMWKKREFCCDVVNSVCILNLSNWLRSIWRKCAHLTRQKIRIEKCHEVNYFYQPIKFYFHHLSDATIIYHHAKCLMILVFLVYFLLVSKRALQNSIGLVSQFQHSFGTKEIFQSSCQDQILV